MTDHTEQLSVLLPVPAGHDTAETNQPIKDWIKHHRDEDELLYDNDHQKWFDLYGGLAIAESPCDIAGVVAPWIYLDGSGSAEAAANLIQLYLNDFEIAGGVFAAYASICSKPLVNEASGAGIVVTREEIRWVSVHDVGREAIADGINILN